MAPGQGPSGADGLGGSAVPKINTRQAQAQRGQLQAQGALTGGLEPGTLSAQALEQQQQEQQARHHSSTILDLDAEREADDDLAFAGGDGHRNSISNHTVITESTTPLTIGSLSSLDEDDFADTAAANMAEADEVATANGHVGHHVYEAHAGATAASFAASLPPSALPGASLAPSQRGIGAAATSPPPLPPPPPPPTSPPPPHAKMAFGNAEVLVAASNGLVVGATPTVSSSQKPHGQSGDPSFSFSEIPDWIRKYETVMGHVNQYVMFDRIGSGAQGSVYKCLNLKDKQIYAIKALENASLRKRRKPGSSINSLKNEIGIMKMLDHPNLVKLYEVIDDLQNDRLYLVIDYVQGGGIMGDHDLMKGGAELAIPEYRAQMLFGDFVLGMEYLHNHGVLHRDIKPSNMLIDNNTEDGEPRVKVCDFGVSSLCNREKSAKVLGEDDLIYVAGFGTVAMMSPEALGCGPDAIYHGRPADVWAAGVTLYCMVTGTLPWRAKDAESLSKEIRTHNPIVFPQRPKLSKEVRRLISKMLDRDPNQRITFSLIRQEPWFQNAPTSGYASHLSWGGSERLEMLAGISSSTSWSSTPPLPAAPPPPAAAASPGAASVPAAASGAGAAASDSDEDRVGESSSGHSHGSSSGGGGLLDSFRRSSWGNKGRSGRIGSIKAPRDTWLANIQAVLNSNSSSRKHGSHGTHASSASGGSGGPPQHTRRQDRLSSSELPAMETSTASPSSTPGTMSPVTHYHGASQSDASGDQAAARSNGHSSKGIAAANGTDEDHIDRADEASAHG